MLLTKIALVAPRGQSLQRIRTVLANPLRYSIREFQTMEEVQAKLSSYPFQVLIARFPRFTKDHAVAIARLRAMYPQSPLITLAPSIDPTARYDVRSVVGHKLLDDENEIQDLPAVIENLLENELAKQRLHPRARRTGHAEISDSEGKWTAEAHFLDFAQMGARLMVDTSEKLQAKTRVRVSYQSSSDPTRTHRIESQIIWAESGSSRMESWMGGARKAVGVRFIAAV